MFKIAIDFDETLFPTLTKVIELYNKKHNTSLELSQITTYNLHDSLPTEVADELLELFVDKETYSCLQPYKGAVRAVKTLVELTEKAGAKVLDTVKIKYPGFFGGVSEETKKVVTETVAKYYAELNN